MHLSGPRPLGDLLESFVHVLLFEVDCLGLAVGSSQLETLRDAVDRDDASRLEHPCALMANCPTGPQPHTATVSPGSMSAFSAAMYPVGKMSERKSTLSSGRSDSIFSAPKSA